MRGQRRALQHPSHDVMHLNWLVMIVVGTSWRRRKIPDQQQAVELGRLVRLQPRRDAILGSIAGLDHHGDLVGQRDGESGLLLRKPPTVGEGGGKRPGGGVQVEADGEPHGMIIGEKGIQHEQDEWSQEKRPPAPRWHTLPPYHHDCIVRSAGSSENSGGSGVWRFSPRVQSPTNTARQDQRKAKPEKKKKKKRLPLCA